MQDAVDISDEGFGIKRKAHGQNSTVRATRYTLGGDSFDV